MLLRKHKHHHPHLPPMPPEPRPLAAVRAGCTVRMSVRVTDGDVALDWDDPNLELKDVRIWSDARRGLIGRAVWEVDGDDPTILRATYDTGSADLPGLHRICVDFSYNGWTAAHSVPAYWLVPGVFCSKGEKVAVKECGCEPDIDVRIVLHDVSTTYLQSLIDQMLSLRESENERLTAVEQMTQLALVRLDSLAGRLAAMEECCEAVKETLADLESRVSALEDGEKPEPEPEQVTFAIEVELEQPEQVSFGIDVELE